MVFDRFTYKNSYEYVSKNAFFEAKSIEIFIENNPQLKWIRLRMKNHDNIKSEKKRILLYAIDG